MKDYELQFIADLEQERQDLRAEHAELSKQVADIVGAGEREAWETIVRKADARVQKSAEPISKEAGIAAYLRTPQGQADYVAYTKACSDRREVIEKSAAAVSERELQRWASERYWDIVSKCDSMSWEEAEAFAAERLGPEVTRLAKAAS